LLDGIASKPEFDTGIVIIIQPEDLKCFCRMIMPAEKLSNRFSFDSVEGQWYDCH
jgi:hypothetical protein